MTHYSYIIHCVCHIVSAQRVTTHTAGMQSPLPILNVPYYAQVEKLFLIVICVAFFCDLSTMFFVYFSIGLLFCVNDLQELFTY